MTIRSTVQDGLLLSFSLLVTGVVSLSVLTVQVGLVGTRFVLFAVALLASAVAFRYAAVYHPFSDPRHRLVAVVVLAAPLLASGALVTASFRPVLASGDLQSLFSAASLSVGNVTSRPRWWLVGYLSVTGVLCLVGLTDVDHDPYPRPRGLRAVARSPPAFGLACLFFGLWAVLFVGIAIQRIVVIAPIFEELLKFGTAILVGSVLFGRSLAGRVGVALTVGALFGFVEHVTSYPLEADAIYAFRTLFHSATTVLSVTAYTLFEANDEYSLQWLAPVYAVLIHFFYNTFVVLSAVVGLLVFGTQNDTVTTLYGGFAIALLYGLVVLRMVSPRSFVGIYRPFENLIADVF